METTRTRIRQVAEELDYHPHALARGLVTGHANFLAIQISGQPQSELLPQDAFFSQVLNGASTRAVELGYAPMLLPAAVSAGVRATLPIDGALLIDPNGAEDLLRDCRVHEVPAVAIGRVPGHPEVPWVDNDHSTITQLVLEHLHARGCRRPALITTDGPVSYSKDAASRYEAWCRDLAVAPIIVRSGPTDADIRSATTTLLDRDARPDAVFVTPNAFPVISTLRERSLQIPHDIAVVAMNDSPASRMADPAITSINPHAEEIGRVATELLVGMIEDPESVRWPVVVESTLIVRASSA